MENPGILIFKNFNTIIMEEDIMYYILVKDPETGKYMPEIISDEMVEQDDLIYDMPGGIENYDKLKYALELIDEEMHNILSQNISINLKGNILKPKKKEKSKYTDPLLQKIEQENTPVEGELILKDKSWLDSKKYVKLEGRYKPKRAQFDKILNYDELIKINTLEQENLDRVTQQQQSLPSITSIKRGGTLKILGTCLKIRPAASKDEGLFLIDDRGQKFEITDFTRINSVHVLLVDIPKDFPIGTYRFFVKSGWYADPGIERTGISDQQIQIV